MKYPVSLRLAAVKYYLSGKGSFSSTAKHFNIGRTPLRRWVEAFNKNGEAGLEHRTRTTYSPEFKLSVVHYVTDHECTLSSAARHFDIPFVRVHQWVTLFHSVGEYAFSPLTARQCMPDKKSASADKAFSDMTVQELKEELGYLRAENAYLKKLKALREKEALKAQKKK